MVKRWLGVVALCALLVGFGLPLLAAPASHTLAPPAQPRPSVPSRGVSPDQPFHEQMRAFDRAAKIDMLLYTGHFGPPDRSAIRSLHGTLPGRP